ncbi:MAG: DUF2188 domain-containing protein [Sphingobacteriaceae bacterium]|nr:MAG: DUF2188 domain-containing protein [Sphingobacteriaceae bacterium]
MAKRNQQVIPLGNGWAVKGEGSKKFTIITELQKDAITVARGIAKTNKSKLLIYGKNGEIKDKSSYENDTEKLQDTNHKLKKS